MKLRALFMVLLASALSSISHSVVDYSVSLDIPAKSIRVSVRVEKPGQELVARIPAWCPGFYFLQKFETKLSNLVALGANGKTLDVETVDSRTWKIKNPTSQDVHVTYSVLGDDAGLGFFGVCIKEHTTFINGPAAFLYFDSHKSDPCTLKIHAPENWPIAIALDKINELYQAKDYDELVDSPIQVGGFTVKQFENLGKLFEVVWVPPVRKILVDIEAQTKVLQLVVTPIMQVFGSASFKRFVFFVHLSNEGFGGGLEHRASTVLAVPNSPSTDLTTLGAHEFFHAWNVKQIRPAALGPFDYSQPCRTKHLWWCEGVTDYYAQLMSYRAGLRSESWLLERFASEIGKLERSNVAKKKSVESASMEAWENGGFGIGDLSYYNKGLVIGLLLDAYIRSSNQGKIGLDNVMQQLSSKHNLQKPGFQDNELLDAISGAAQKDTGKLYDSMIRSVDPLPYDLLSGIGLRVIRPGESVRTLGFVTDGNRIVSIHPNIHDLRVGDVIEMLNGELFDDAILSSEATEYSIQVLRSNKVLEFTLPIVTTRNQEWRVERDPFCKREAVARRAVYFAFNPH